MCPAKRLEAHRAEPAVLGLERATAFGAMEREQLTHL